MVTADHCCNGNGVAGYNTIMITDVSNISFFGQTVSTEHARVQGHGFNPSYGQICRILEWCPLFSAIAMPSAMLQRPAKGRAGVAAAVRQQLLRQQLLVAHVFLVPRSAAPPYKADIPAQSAPIAQCMFRESNALLRKATVQLCPLRCSPLNKLNTPSTATNAASTRQYRPGQLAGEWQSNARPQAAPLDDEVHEHAAAAADQFHRCEATVT